MTKYENIEAEQVIIGSAIMNNSLLLNIADILEEKHFYYEEHKIIWQEFIKIGREGGTADPVTLKDCLNNVAFKHLGGSKYLLVLMQLASGTADIRGYAKTLIELWKKRELEVLIENCKESLQDKNFDYLSSKLQNDMLKLDSNNPVQKVQHISEVITDIENDERSLLDNDFVTTGFNKLNHILNGGFYKKQLVVVGARPSVGKEQSLDCAVLLQDGTWSKMRNLKIGDKLASHDGRDSEVKGIFPQGKKDLYRITFSDGRSTLAGLDHNWQIGNRKWKDDKILTTRELIEYLKKPSYKNRIYTPFVSGDFGKSIDLKINPWILGVLIGDGNLTKSINLTNSDQKIVDKVRDVLGSKFCVKNKGSSKIDYSITEPKSNNNQLIQDLRDYKLIGCRSYEKFIPKEYLKASRIDRLSLFQGLMDTDGWAEKGGSTHYSTSSKKLSKDIQYLVRSLGGFCTIKNKQPYYTYKGIKLMGRINYICNIRMQNPTECFTKENKLSRVKERGRLSSLRLNISSIEFEKTEEAQCIKVSHPSSLYVTDDFIVTHNTSIAQQMILKASESGKKCLFISLEVDKKNVFLKFVSNMVSIDGYKLQMRKFNQSELESIKQAKEDLKELNIYVNDSSSLNVSQIENIIKKQLEIEPVDMVFIDYIQIIRFLNQGNFNEASAIKENTSRLKEIAKKYNVGVVALAQISRKGVENNQEPTVNDLKGSGGIEEDADVAILLHRDKNEEEGGGYFSNNGKLIIAKNRHGATGVVGFEFEGKFSRFTESVNNF
jgi:replicative DNA helicase